MRTATLLRTLPVMVLLLPAAPALAGGTQVDWVGSRSLVYRPTGDGRHTVHEDGNGARVFHTGRSGTATTSAVAVTVPHESGVRSAGSPAPAPRTLPTAEQRRAERLVARRATTLAVRIDTLRGRLSAAGFHDVEVVGEGRASIVRGEVDLRGGKMRWELAVDARGRAAHPPLDTAQAQALLDRYFFARQAAGLGATTRRVEGKFGRVRWESSPADLAAAQRASDELEEVEGKLAEGGITSNFGGLQ